MAKVVAPLKTDPEPGVDYLVELSPWAGEGESLTMAIQRVEADAVSDAERLADYWSHLGMMPNRTLVRSVRRRGRHVWQVVDDDGRWHRLAVREVFDPDSIETE